MQRVAYTGVSDKITALHGHGRKPGVVDAARMNM